MKNSSNFMSKAMSILSLLVISLCFPTTTAAIANSGGFSALSPTVRDYYSKEVIFQAQPRCKFMQFSKVKRDLQAIRSKSIVFVKYNNLSGGGSLLESDTLTPVAMGASEVSIAVQEQANAVQLTELLMRVAITDVLGDATKALANNLAVVLDKQFRDVALATTNIVYGDGAASSSAMTTNSVFNAKTLKDAVELLQVNNAPKFAGDYYVCISHPKQLRQLRDDGAWQAANTYMGRRQLYVGEVGMYEGVIFIDSTNMPHLTSAQVVTKYGGTFAPTHACEAVIFGENAYGWAIALDPELRDDGVVELGRKHTIGWYGIWGMGILEEDNIVRVLSAATA